MKQHQFYSQNHQQKRGDCRGNVEVETKQREQQSVQEQVQSGHGQKPSVHPAKVKRSFIREVIGKRVVVVMKNGVVQEGVVKWYSEGFLYLADGVIKGKSYMAKVPFVLIDRAYISHVHPLPDELKPVESV